MYMYVCVVCYIIIGNYHYYNMIAGDTSSAGWMGGVYTIHVCVCVCVCVVNVKKLFHIYCPVGL